MDRECLPRAYRSHRAVNLADWLGASGPQTFGWDFPAILQIGIFHVRLDSPGEYSPSCSRIVEWAFRPQDFDCRERFSR
jgi:hypothetical protein